MFISNLVLIIKYNNIYNTIITNAININNTITTNIKSQNLNTAVFIILFLLI